MTMKNTDLLALQAYVTAQDDSQYDNVRQDTVVLDLTHSNLVQRHVEIRFDLHDTLDTLRQRIYLKTGTPASFQHLQIISGASILGEIPPSIPGERYQLGYYGLQHGMTIHCIDIDPHSGSRGGQYENVSLVQKFEMTDEEYRKRKGTLYDWKRHETNKNANFSLAKHAQQHAQLCQAQRHAKLGLPLPPNYIQDATTGTIVHVEPDPKDQDDNYGQESLNGIEVGMRCEVQPGGRRGVVAYCGLVPEIGTTTASGASGYWVGVVFDEPVGKTDGMAGTKRYFGALPGFGGFVRGKNVTVGDYPERDIFNDLEDDDNDSDDEL